MASQAEVIDSEALSVVQALPVEALLTRAIEVNVPVESLERLLAMRTQLKAERAREAFIEAMAAFQSECPTIPKTKTAGAGTYSYKFAPLEVIVERTSDLRSKYGFSYRFDTQFEESPPAQVVSCIVSHRDGHQETSQFRSPIDSGARMNVMQQSASSLTYAKRYAFINAFGIVTGDEDNDAQTAAVPSKPQPATRPQQAAVGGTSERKAREDPGYSPSAVTSAPPPRPLAKNPVTLRRKAADSEPPAAEPTGEIAPEAAHPDSLKSAAEVAQGLKIPPPKAGPQTFDDLLDWERTRVLQFCETLNKRLTPPDKWTPGKVTAYLAQGHTPTELIMHLEDQIAGLPVPRAAK